MSLNYKFFIIPIRDIEASEAELNRFLSSVRVVRVNRDFIDDGGNSFWSISVEYMADGQKTGGEQGRKKRIDYREVLPPEDFKLFARIRTWRKAKAAEEGIPIYSVFNNEHLSKISEGRITTKAGLLKIEGIGDERVKKYGDAVIEIVSNYQQEIQAGDGKENAEEKKDSQKGGKESKKDDIKTDGQSSLFDSDV